MTFLCARNAERCGCQERGGTVLSAEWKGNLLMTQQTTEFAPQEYPVALNYWADACGGDAGWLALDEVEDDGEVMVQSVGFLIPVGDAGSKENHMTLLQSIHDGEGINLFYIPVAMVRKIVLLNA